LASTKSVPKEDFIMSKLTAFAIGLLTVISIAPQHQAMATNITPVTVERPAGDIAQITVKIGGQPQYSNRWEVQRRRQLELEREREREREADRRRREYYSQRNHDRYHGEYHRR
jgi:hypothetical protein